LDISEIVSKLLNVSVREIIICAKPFEKVSYYYGFLIEQNVVIGSIYLYLVLTLFTGYKYDTLD